MTTNEAIVWLKKARHFEGSDALLKKNIEEDFIKPGADWIQKKAKAFQCLVSKLGLDAAKKFITESEPHFTSALIDEVLKMSATTRPECDVRMANLFVRILLARAASPQRN